MCQPFYQRKLWQRTAVLSVLRDCWTSHISRAGLLKTGWHSNESSFCSNEFIWWNITASEMAFSREDNRLDERMSLCFLAQQAGTSISMMHRIFLVDVQFVEG